VNLPSCPPRSSWIDENEDETELSLDTSPTAATLVVEFPPFDTTVSHRAIEAIRWAERFSAAGQHAGSRRQATTAVQELCRAMRLSDRVINAIWALVVTDGHADCESPYDAALRTGEIEEDRR
jgi:hypothetical protein